MKYKCIFKEGWEVRQQKDFSSIQEVIHASQLWTRFEKVELQDGGKDRFIMVGGNYSVEVTLEVQGWA